MEKGVQIFRFPATLLFLVLLASAFLNQWTGYWQFERKAENRSFQDSLAVDYQHLDKFPADFEAYLQDNFSFRRPLLDWYHQLSFYYYKISPDPKKTQVGKDNWYFMAGKEKSIVAGDLKFTKEELQQLENNWRQRKHYLDSLNIPFLWLVAPMKHHIYLELLPFESRIAKEDRTQQLVNHFNKKLPGVLVDLKPSLLEAKKDAKLFYQLDNHWNFHAGEVVARFIINQLQTKYPHLHLPELQAIQWRDTVLQNGIHYHVLGIDALSELDQIPIMPNAKAKLAIKHDFPVIPNFAYPDEYEIRYLNPVDSTGLRLLVIRDSFGSQLLPFLKESFQETVFIFDAWRYGLNPEIIAHLKPDVMLFLGSEVHIDNMLH